MRWSEVEESTPNVQGSWDYVVNRIKLGYNGTEVEKKSCYYCIGEYLRHHAKKLQKENAKIVFYKLSGRYYHGAIELPDGQIFECNVPSNFRDHGVEQADQEIHTIPEIVEIITA